jgi:hypothetical protein
VQKFPKDGIFLAPEYPMSLWIYDCVVRRIWKRGVTRDETWSEEQPTGLDVSGNSTTDANGHGTLRLSDLADTPHGVSHWSLMDPISFVATPVTDKPAILTVTLKMDETIRCDITMNDLVVHIYSWDMQGNPSKNIRFCWRCRVKAHPVVV